MEPFLSETLRARQHLLYGYQSITFNTSKGEMVERSAATTKSLTSTIRLVGVGESFDAVRLSRVARQDALFVCPFGSIAPPNGPRRARQNLSP